MRQAKVRFNYKDYLLLPEDKRYEILDVDLYLVPAPKTRHQRISLNLSAAIHQYVRQRGLGQVLEAPCDVVLSNEDIVQPDILFIRKAHAFLIGEANITGAPDLVIEILSAGTRKKDIELKRKIYARFKVAEYWIVDPDAETVEILT